VYRDGKQGTAVDRNDVVHHGPDRQVHGAAVPELYLNGVRWERLTPAHDRVLFSVYAIAGVIHVLSGRLDRRREQEVSLVCVASLTACRWRQRHPRSGTVRTFHVRIRHETSDATRAPVDFSASCPRPGSLTCSSDIGTIGAWARRSVPAPC
jgi:hypothetical protein